MLARSLTLELEGKVVGKTPMLVPAFSSKADPAIGLIIESLEEYLSGPILVSAYDVKYNKTLKLPINFGDPVFLDSGGYECSQDTDLADTALSNYRPEKWTPEEHNEVVDKWPNNRPTVIVSYDHPDVRTSIKKQIDSAQTFFAGRTNVITEMLLKPETDTQRYIEIKSIVDNLEAMRAFDIIGITEKELGSNLLKRLENVARIRIAMDELDIRKPIHLFGSLDPIACPIFFIAGADIFDGLTWLRYAFIDGLAVYEHHYGVIRQPYDYHYGRIRVQRLVDNLAELNRTRQQMVNYLMDGDFRHFRHLRKPTDYFKPHQELIKDVYTALRSQLGSRGKEV
jgi:regulator of sigma D